MPFTALLDRQRRHFASGATLPLEARQGYLAALREMITDHQTQMAEALAADLGKSPAEAHLTETGMLLAELTHLEKALPRLLKPKKAAIPAVHRPARGEVRPMPYGSTLILSPWNYPLLLSLQPLMAALAAGNTVLLKPSAYAPASSALLKEMLDKTFDPDLVAVVEGGREQNAALLEQRYDLIFFTGSPAVGRVVMERAAKHLTPVVLELGGKSPVYVDKTADLKVAARRIVFGKLINAGQTCVAPDYVLAHRMVKRELTELLLQELARQGGPRSGPLPHIVNEKHAERLKGLLDGQRLLCGGRWQGLTLSPTLVDEPDPASPLMQEEIFGPILPVLTVNGREEATAFLRARPAPLACYLFGREKALTGMAEALPFGGGCLNDTIVHLACPELPFGGVGESGMGRYHGDAGFWAFSYPKSLLVRGAGPDLPVRYRPYGKWKAAVVKKVLK
ncbi:MAG: aldehyde dehydrogenase family protein [Clostridia bacterium]|nr:aldehyde dehydrogenase family protein [Clostridia bacterium]